LPEGPAPSPDFAPGAPRLAALLPAARRRGGFETRPYESGAPSAPKQNWADALAGMNGGAYRQGNALLGLFPGIEADFGFRRQHRGLHGDAVWVRRDIVREDQYGRLATPHEIARHRINEVPFRANLRWPDPANDRYYLLLVCYFSAES
jgi:hypothetical protein